MLIKNKELNNMNKYENLENLINQLDNINAEYEKKMDKLRAKQDRDASFMWQRIAIEKAKLREGDK
jgi:hypothetical protein